ncbi:MAG: class I SAM-dependent methyltransferase [Candidatus Sulfotelmatobacter sp.]|jgi:SAM-dependent methyltransferase
MDDSPDSPSSRISIARSAWHWCGEIAALRGRIAAIRELLTALAGLIRDSTPQRRRQHYGDADFDWDHRVNTTSAAVGWRDRLLGVFHSPYQPTESALFHEMIGALSKHPTFDFREFIFIDLGSGKGRTLLMASDYSFRQIMGVELLPALYQIAQENLARYHSPAQQCFAIEAICGDATDFSFPAEATVLFLFNPFTESGLKRVIANLERSLQQHPRSVLVLYHNPLLAQVLDQSAALKKIGGTHQYAMYASR